ncbi:hypothetical protein BD779DRAFT_1670921 [Infundibulicybe gibba]|nr:hypothetical protein BD779DRAFT_1670921 [Infundibulicybe gibba]
MRRPQQLDAVDGGTNAILTRGYQQEMLEESLNKNIIIALDTGSGKTHIAILRIKIELDREPNKISWFLAPTVALCEQQKKAIQAHLPTPVGLISGALEPNQWKDANLWSKVLRDHRVMVSTPQVLLDALRHGYILLGRDISLLVFDEAHHAVDNHPYNRIMQEFYFDLPARPQSALAPTSSSSENVDHQYLRPMALGLTASPIYGGNVVKAFETIESNLNCVIRAPRQNREELAKFVHRPSFRHALYSPPDSLNPQFSTNLAALDYLLSTMDIEKDPQVISLRKQLSNLTKGTAEYQRLDQKLSAVILKESSFTHKGLRDFARSAGEICEDLGSWAADWYVWEVYEHAKRAANPFANIISTWRDTEKAYLLSLLNTLVLSPVSYHPDDILEECSDKVRVLTQCLISEKTDTEANDESYSGLIFVQRRDTVLALSHVLSHHPATSASFRVGCLLGSSDSMHRHSFLDITRHLLRDLQRETLDDFREGEKNVIVSTSVAEEGIDIQACGSVIRWDPPANMASWAQSRGRARRKRSTYTGLFPNGGHQQHDVAKWIKLEAEMVALYNDPSRDQILEQEDEDVPDDPEDDLKFQVESTGALLTLHSAVAHLNHFCAVIPNTSHADNRPIYDIDPPDLPEGWHSFENRSRSSLQRYTGPYGCRVTLPKLLPVPFQHFEVERKYPNKTSAYRHVAFVAYRALYHAGLLNENLLPLTSVVEPGLEEEVKELLKEVEQRAGMANVSIQMDPWVAGGSDVWFRSSIAFGNLNPISLLTQSNTMSLVGADGPVLYRPGHPPVQAVVQNTRQINLSSLDLVEAQAYTRRLFWTINGARMQWNNFDFSYLFLPGAGPATGTDVWAERRAWNFEKVSAAGKEDQGDIIANAQAFGEKYNFPDSINVVFRQSGFGRPFKFLRWRSEPLSELEEERLLLFYRGMKDIEITYPLLVVEPYPARTNLLIPTLPPDPNVLVSPKIIFNLIPALSSIALVSPEEIEYAFLLPSFLRSTAMALTVDSFRTNLLAQTPLYGLPTQLLTVALTAPVSQERVNYQRLETLGDTVLKLVCGIQLLAEYPLWHEGYLTRKKDHSVSNARLAKEDIARGLFAWIIRDRMLGKKWVPSYLSVKGKVPESESKPEQNKNRQPLSTKVLADVVESLIGAAYLHGGIDLGYECAKFFDLGLKWQPLPERLASMLLRVEKHENVPPQLAYVEAIIGYNFNHKLLLVEALTHSSYEQDLRTMSYERLEFLGDSVLDMVVTDYLYHAPGKNYSPGHMHLRKSAVVNAHILAFICLNSSLEVSAGMPQYSAEEGIVISQAVDTIHLWQCLLHSSPGILMDQKHTFRRFEDRRVEITEALERGDAFPWAALTRLQAPKFFSDMVESLIGAVYLDSSGDFEVIRGVLRKLGTLTILERIVRDGIDILHPVSRLSVWASKYGRELEYKYNKEKGNISCTIKLDGKEEIQVTEIYRGHASQEEVKYMAAEEIIQRFKLREPDVIFAMNTKAKEKKKQRVSRLSFVVQ